MAKTSNYWDKRALRRLTDAEKISEQHITEIKKIYEQAYRDVSREIQRTYRAYAKNTGLDVDKLRELLTVKETDKVWKTLKRQGLDQYIKDNYKSRISRLEQIQAQIYGKAKLIYPKEELQQTMAYKGVINNSYYKAIYDTQKGLGYDFSFNKIDNNTINLLLNEKWSGLNYSQRIWKNTDYLAEALSYTIGGAMLSGQSIEKTTKQIKERFNVSKYYAERLVRTETNHFNNEADAMAYESMDIKKYVFVATLDSRTSEICQSHDNKVYNFKDRETGVNYPPLHPNCRSKTRGYISEEVERTLKRRARNPKTGKTEVIDNISYKDWAKKNGLTTNLSATSDKKTIKSDKLKKLPKNDIINREHKIANGKNIIGKYDITEDELLNDGGVNKVMELQGYKGLPKIVSDEEFEKYTKESGFFAQRTYGGKTKEELYSYQNDLYNKEWYIDCSVGGSQYGKGMYCASVYNLKDENGLNGITEEMKHYIELAKIRKTNYHIIEDLTIDKSAKIIEFNDVRPTYIKELSKTHKWSNEEITLYDRYFDSFRKFKTANQNYITSMLNQNDNGQKYMNDYYKYQKEVEEIQKQFTPKMIEAYKSIKNKDTSTLAVEMGYDVINAKGHGKSGSYSVILNRTKLIIRKGGQYYE